MLKKNQPTKLIKKIFILEYCSRTLEYIEIHYLDGNLRYILLLLAVCCKWDCKEIVFYANFINGLCALWEKITLFVLWHFCIFYNWQRRALSNEYKMICIISVSWASYDCSIRPFHLLFMQHEFFWFYNHFTLSQMEIAFKWITPVLGLRYIFSPLQSGDTEFYYNKLCKKEKFIEKCN